MLYTGKGDTGTTRVLDSKERMTKSSALAEALGSMDEVNSFLGLCKVKSTEKDFVVDGELFKDLVHAIQKNLFIIQAELAGAGKTIDEEKLRHMEKVIGIIERELPPITSFFISGGTELAALFDVARTLARRAERRVVAVHESKVRELGAFSLAYLNRLSSILYALARLSNHKSGIKEDAPDYT